MRSPRKRRTLVMTPRRIDPGPYLSRAVVAGDFVFVAGLSAGDPPAPPAPPTPHKPSKKHKYPARARPRQSHPPSAPIRFRAPAPPGEEKTPPARGVLP